MPQMDSSDLGARELGSPIVRGLHAFPVRFSLRFSRLAAALSGAGRALVLRPLRKTKRECPRGVKSQISDTYQKHFAFTVALSAHQLHLRITASYIIFLLLQVSVLRLSI